MDAAVEDVKNRSLTQRRGRTAPPCTLVIFGAGGDLTKRLLMPAIYNLSKSKLLSDKFAIIAVDRTPKPVEAYRDYLADGIRSFVSDTASAPATEPFDARAWDFVASRITHFAGEMGDPTSDKFPGSRIERLGCGCRGSIRDKASDPVGQIVAISLHRFRGAVDGDDREFVRQQLRLRQIVDRRHQEPLGQ